MSSYDEDMYRLEQAKKLFSDMYTDRVRERTGKGEEDRYAYHLGQAVRDIDYAIEERKTEKPRQELRDYFLNLSPDRLKTLEEGL